MMRGVGTWAVAVRLPHGKPQSATRPQRRLGRQRATPPRRPNGRSATAGSRPRHRARPDGEPLGEIDVHRESSPRRSRSAGGAAADHPRRHRAVRVAQDRHARRSASPPTRSSTSPRRRSAARPGASRSSCRSPSRSASSSSCRSTLANFWKDDARQLGRVRRAVEKLIRIAIFLGYLWAISRIPDLRRVFEYHGAEHKVISCYEAGDAARPRERAALLALPRALRHQLPADRDDHRRLRLRPDRPAGAALADPLADPRPPSSPGSPTR